MNATKIDWNHSSYPPGTRFVYCVHMETGHVITLSPKAKTEWMPKVYGDDGIPYKRFALNVKGEIHKRPGFEDTEVPEP